MAGSMDLEARLRALRTTKRSSAAPPASSGAPAASWSMPDSISTCTAAQNKISISQPFPDTGSGGDRAVPASFSRLPVVTRTNDCSVDDSTGCASVVTSVAPRRAVEPAPALENALPRTTAAFLGPDYEKAVAMAQYAIDRERRQMPHTAIDAYVQAGQMLIAIGRRQAAPYLQDIVKAKALALLQRAEGLSAWTNDVLAKDSSQHALAAAYQQSQQNRTKWLTEKQSLVSRMQQDNRDMQQRLNQLALVTTIRSRMVRVVRNRRARKAAEAKENEETKADAGACIMGRHGGVFHDETGEVHDDLCEDGDDSPGGPNDVTGSSSDDEDEEPRNGDPHYQTRPASATGASPREAQKFGLINELHERIGLPHIDQFRTFEPLTNDPTTDKEQEQLQSELEAAKQEADTLRAAVQEMERCLQLAAQHSKQRSLQLEQQKAQEFAKVQSELDRVRHELDVARQRSTSLQSGPSSWRSSMSSDPGGGETKQDTGTRGHVRSSLRKVFRGRDAPGGMDAVPSRRASVERPLYDARESPRHTPPKSKERNSTDVEQDDDGGVWL